MKKQKPFLILWALNDYKGTSQINSKRFTERGWKDLGERQNVTPSDVEKIVEMAY